MAFVKCPECKKEISSEAFDCPNCGCPVKKKPKSSLDKLLDVVRFVVITFIALFLLSLAGATISNLMMTRYSDSVSKDDEIVLKKQWRQLKRGMTQKQVKDILGEPIKVENMSLFLRWDYDNFGSVEFPMLDYNGNKDRLDSWHEPMWQH